MNKKFRWRYFIDKPFQLRFIYRFSILIIISLAVAILALGVVNNFRYNKGLYFMTDSKKLQALYNESDTDKAKDTIVLNKYFNMGKPENIFEIYVKPLVGMSVIFILVIALFGLFISHKMAGPVYRIKRTLEEAASGKIDIKTLRFRLRKGDELQDLVESLNKFIESKK